MTPSAETSNCISSQCPAASNLRFSARRHLPAFLVLLLLAFPHSGYGMDFSVAFLNPFIPGSEAAYPTLLMKGDILPGDYDRLLTFAVTNNVDLASIQFTLASPGGDVSEALKIGQLLKSLYASVAVGPVTGRCASACFIIFASAVERASAGGLVGIHRPYVDPDRMRSLSPGAAEALETRALLDAEQYLHRLRVPTNIVDEMFEHASTEIDWLTDDELLHELGERPPWYEEFLIARCGLDKATQEQFLQDPDNAALFNSLMAVFDCGSNLTHPEAVKALNEALAPYRARSLGAQQGHKAVWAALSATIPNWKRINTSPDFVAWLDHDDGLARGGQTKHYILKTAFNDNDAALVVAIFKAYVEDNAKHEGTAFQAPSH
jgi:hypothetical protein